LKVTVWLWPLVVVDSFDTFWLPRICTTSALSRLTEWVWPLPRVSSSVTSPPAVS
jgi:hypothetical protein